MVATSSKDVTQHAPQAKKKSGLFGPGLLISASFIGPGTVTTATVTGANYGFALTWTIVFSIVATIILQEMAVRLGLAAKLSTGEALRRTFESPIAKGLMITLIVAAIGIGGASYAGGDTTGTALALSSVTGIPLRLMAVIIVVIILGLLLSGSYKLIERVMTFFVVVLAIIFMITAVITKPDLGAMLSGIFKPTIPEGSLLSAIALIGTTVVPYNVFLHSNLVMEKWGDEPSDESLRKGRIDNAISISIGGLITLAILSTAAAVMFTQGMEAKSAADLAEPLRPMLGGFAPWALALGLFSAGLTSALAGPLGAAYAICGVLGWSTDIKDKKFRVIFLTVVIIGGIIAVTGVNPIQIIVVAQAANGLLLPIVALFLLITMNNRRLLKDATNGWLANLLGALIFLVTVVLGGIQLFDLF
ncbi:Nramp family divalent metal transporter [uncultured Corynebacterium sp.]|uniref:Nramp family divalent metal transporter n=1 Tax=uncultured Corynebacterium sp. TaxID=159447 RepID=UPI0025D1170C|nr:Nramp family divalent metal transporter [uncultured Corynebacterium sp.]